MNQKIVLIPTLIFAGVIGALSPIIHAQEPAPSTTIQPVFEEFKPAPENPPATAPPKSASPTAPPQKSPPKPQPAPAATPPKPTSQPAPPPAQAQFAPANARPPAPPTLAELPPLKTPGQEKFMETLGYQILLDRLFFSPGCIDGVMGPQTREAIVAFQFDRNLPLTGQLDAQTRQALGPLTNLITSHTVTPEETARLRPVPALWRERAAEPALEYETLLELVAEKYHASQNGIRRLNPNIDWPNPPAGTVVSVPNVTLGKLPKAGLVQIALSRRQMRVFDRAGRLIAQFPCSIAQKEEKRPVGRLEVINYAPNPTYLFSPDLFKEDARKEGIKGKLVIPAGPNNPVGLAWIGLNRPGYGIHGTPRPEDIGLTESRGCFRLANWNARRLMGATSIGLPVDVELDFPR